MQAMIDVLEASHESYHQQGCFHPHPSFQVPVVLQTCAHHRGRAGSKRPENSHREGKQDANAR